MSFISKLFHKGDSAEGEAASKLREAAETLPAPDDGPQSPADAEPAEAVKRDGAAGDEPAAEPAAPGAEAAPEEDAGTPWWEEAAPAEAADRGEAQEESAQIATAARAANGTEPLDERDAPERAAPAESSTVEEEEGGTRPLTAADVPALAALRSRRGLAAAALRDVGRVRQINQDSVFALITTLPRESSDVSLGLFIVADGMGGHHGGEVASRIAISTVAHYILAELVVPALTDGATEALQPLLVAAVQEANRAIWEHAQLVGSDMGTTCSVALLLGKALYVGHVGDSRAYLATPTGLRQITDDHSTVGRLIKLGQLDPAEAREHPLRSQLYRTIGQQPEVLVDFVYQQVGDANHLLMCSDGLWGMLGDDVMLDVLEHSIWPQDACHELIARANLAGGDDNITAIVVTLPT
jgi:serine/threonine protein phosphatase PrpC